MQLPEVVHEISDRLITYSARHPERIQLPVSHHNIERQENNGLRRPSPKLVIGPLFQVDDSPIGMMIIWKQPNDLLASVQNQGRQ